MMLPILWVFLEMLMLQLSLSSSATSSLHHGGNNIYNGPSLRSSKEPNEPSLEDIVLSPEYRIVQKGHPDKLDLLPKRLYNYPSRLSLVLSPPIEPDHDYVPKGLKLIFGGKFPPRIEAIVQRVQNYFSTYTQVDGQRPDYDPNRPTELPAPQSTSHKPDETSLVLDDIVAVSDNETDNYTTTEIFDISTTEDYSETLNVTEYWTEAMTTLEDDFLDHNENSTINVEGNKTDTTEENINEVTGEPTTEMIVSTIDTRIEHTTDAEQELFSNENDKEP